LSNEDENEDENVAQAAALLYVTFSHSANLHGIRTAGANEPGESGWKKP